MTRVQKSTDYTHTAYNPFKGATTEIDEDS